MTDWAQNRSMDEAVFAIDQIQTHVHKWARYNFGEQQPHHPLLGVAEEVGELCHAHLKGEQKIRQGNLENPKADAVGDILVYLMNYCQLSGLSMVECLMNVWFGKDGNPGVSDRDWKRFPQNGLTE